MKSKQLGRVLCAVAAFTSVQSFAEFYSGNDLLQRINGETAAERNAAIGYVMGVSDTLLGVTHCAPHDVTSGQIRDMVRNYLTNVPAERHHSADVLIARVLKATWPCPDRQRRGQAL